MSTNDYPFIIMGGGAKIFGRVVKVGGEKFWTRPEGGEKF